MKKVSIIYIAQGSYWSTRHSFESIGFAVKEKETEIIVKDVPKEYIKVIGELEVEFLVANLTGDTRVSEYFKDLATEVIVPENQTLAQTYNTLFRKATGDYVCVIPSGLFLQPNWLTELIYYYVNIGKSGVVGVVSDVEETALLPLPSTDIEHFINVFVPNSNLIIGISFFDRQHLYLIGAFDESVSIEGNEINQFALRCVALGFFNYYVPSDTCVFIGKDAHSLSEESDENMKVSLSEMKKNRNYYIPL